MALFDRTHTTSYVCYVVTMALSCIISEIKREIGRKLRFFIPPAFDVSVKKVPVEVLLYGLVWKN